jgi:hypothetical protein
MRNFALIFVLALVGCATGNPNLSESYKTGTNVILYGRIHETLLLPSGHERCPSPCKKAKDSIDNVQNICISNTCGCDETTIIVGSNSMHDYGAKQAVLSQSLGEWCIPKLFNYTEGFFLLKKDGVLYVTDPIDSLDLKAGPNLEDMNSLGSSATLEPKKLR